MMQTWISPRYFTPTLLVVMTALGLSAGHLTGTIAGLKLSGKGDAPAAPVVRKTGGKQLSGELSAYEIIPQRSLFAPGRPGTLLQGGGGGPAPVRTDLTLLGTIAGGLHPLALIHVGNENRVVRVGDAVAAGKVIAIGRQSLTLRFADGTEQIVTPPEIPSPATGGEAASGTASSSRGGAENRRAISRDEAEKARANLGELMKQARMEPHVVNGQTDGFEVKMVKANTLFTTLGVQKGDIIRQVNGLQLDSPEKALQIFQQLREARHIVIALERNGSPLSLEYDLE